MSLSKTAICEVCKKEVRENNKPNGWITLSDSLNMFSTGFYISIGKNHNMSIKRLDFCTPEHVAEYFQNLLRKNNIDE